MAESHTTVELPRPLLTGETSLESLLGQRRSVRDYSDVFLALADISQLLWAAQGVTHPRGYRTAPSAGALYPLELFVVAGDVKGLEAGIYHYKPSLHRLRRLLDEDLRSSLSDAALSQAWVEQAAVVVVIAADYKRTMRKYGERGRRYVHMEVGHAAQNLLLQAEALGLAAVTVGAFDDAGVARVLQLPEELEPLMLIPVAGKR